MITVVVAIVLATRLSAIAATTNIVSDGNWRVTSPSPQAGWNTSVGFDDSDAAGWEYAFKAPSGNNIWMRSNQSASSPGQVWCRHVFRLPAQPISASGTFNFDDDGQVYVNGTLVINDTGGGATTFNVALATNLFVAGDNLIAVYGVNTVAPFNVVGVDMTLEVPLETSLIATGSVWKYLDNGSDQGVAWQSLTFDDTAWASGPAQLGYGDGDEATTNSFGSDANNKYVTTYYRRSFTVGDASVFTNLQLRLLRDDGAIVYLNGSEVFRCNLPTGAVTYATLAQTAVLDDGTFWIPFDLPVTALRTGTNVIAVEMHQSAGNSTDLSFDFALVANFSPFPPKVNWSYWPVVLGGNGHYYESVAVSGGITWDAASAAATNRGGYLATITSAEENAVLFQLINRRPELWARRSSGDSWGPWIGSLQPAGSVEPAGGWSWITGEPFVYTHWAAGEPSNTSPGEDRLHFIGKHALFGDFWNDKATGDNGVVSYAVEYEQNIGPAPILEFKFNETGSSAAGTGIATNGAVFVAGATTLRDFHSPDAEGVSGRPGDRAFDNSISGGMGSKGSGGRGNVADADAADDLVSLTLQGWFRTDGVAIDNLARLITKQAGSTGFLLLGTGGNLDLEINNAGTTSTGTRYADPGIWVFFAVVYDGTATNNNVRFYKGTPTNSVALVETRTLNQGRALANTSPITIGNANSDGSLMRPFDGLLDNIRLFGDKTNASGALTLQQLEWVRNQDVQNITGPIALSATQSGASSAMFQWPAYPGGYHLESKPKLSSASTWIVVTNAVQLDSGRNTVIIPTGDAPRFFRLARPN